MNPFRKIAGVLTWLGFAYSACLAGDQVIDHGMVPRDRWTGEPYALSGRRLAFASWYYVRPGGYAWVNARGEGVTASQAKIGPEGAFFRRADDSPRGIRLMVEKPQRFGPIVTDHQPWEAMGLSMRFFLRDGGKYRAWGSAQDSNRNGNACYFESTDGRKWHRPNLGLFEYRGSRNNNLLPSAPESVFLDPTAPPAQRYKGVGGGEVSQAEFNKFIAKYPQRWEHRALRKDARFIAAVFGYTSGDGLSWTRLPEPFLVEHSDTQIVGGYDPVRRKYMIFTRNWYVGPRAPEAPNDPSGMMWLGEARGAGRRSIGYTESSQFGDFPLSQVILVPRPDMSPSELLYTNCFTTMPGAPEVQLLFPSVWDTADDATHLEMAVGFQGRVWNWLGGRLMETGTFGRFDGGCIFWHPNLLELGDGDFALPYTGYAFPHKYPRGAWSYRPGYALWPRGRLTGIEAPETGEFSTVSLLPPGKKLRINAVTQRAGRVLIAVTRRDGRPLPGRDFDDAIPIFGDAYRTPVRWKTGDEVVLKPGEPICLKFRLERARVYWLDFE
jgi:hypothetical protein